ncbi:MAG: O-antigen ligase family protein [candidate division FCPU426 bacterium]
MAQLARLLLLSCLVLPGLAFETHAAHAFWAPEAFALRWLAPAAFLAAMAATQARSGPLDKDLKIGAWILGALAGLWLLSAAFSLRPDLGLGELSLWFSYPMLWVATWRLADEAEQRQRLLVFILLAGVIQSLYGLVQSLGLDPLPWNTSFGGRAGGFLGNPDFFGGHLALLLPLSLALALQNENAAKFPGKGLRWGVCALLLAALVASGTRGAWAGALVGCCLTLILYKKYFPEALNHSKKRLWILAGLGALALAAMALAHPGFFARLGGFFGGDDELSRRGLLMRAGLRLAWQHPLLGVGPGQFRIFFPSVQATGLSRELLSSRGYVLSEHSHNDLIQMAADSGILAALLLLALTLWLYRGLGRGLSLLNGEAPLLAGLLGSFAALQVCGMVNFPFLIGPTQATAWALAALGLKIVHAKAQAAPATGSGKKSELRIILLSLGLIAALFGATWAGRLFNQDMLWWTAEGENKLANFPKGAEMARKALTLNPKEDRLWYQMGLARLRQKDNVAGAALLDEAVRLNPHHVEALWELGKARLEMDQPIEAERALMAAAADAPNLPDIWEPLANALFLQQKYEEAIKAYDWALYYHVNPVVILGNKAAALGNLGRYEEALRTLSEAENLDPINAKIHLNRAVTYFKMGIKPLALKSLKRAKELNLDDPTVKVLEKALQTGK